jgi:hypothetical protein
MLMCRPVRAFGVRVKNDRYRSKKARTFVAFLKIIELEYGLFNTNRAVQCRT